MIVSYRMPHEMDETTWRPSSDYHRAVEKYGVGGREPTLKYTDELANGFHVMLDSEELVTVD